MSFGGEERALDVRGAAKATDHTAGADHPVIGQARVDRVAKNAADGSRGAGVPGQPRDVAIRGDLAHRNPCHDAEHVAPEDS